MAHKRVNIAMAAEFSLTDSFPDELLLLETFLNLWT